MSIDRKYRDQPDVFLTLREIVLSFLYGDRPETGFATALFKNPLTAFSLK
jgi:hypothetical protein